MSTACDHAKRAEELTIRLVEEYKAIKLDPFALNVRLVASMFELWMNDLEKGQVERESLLREFLTAFISMTAEPSSSSPPEVHFHRCEQLDHLRALARAKAEDLEARLKDPATPDIIAAAVQEERERCARLCDAAVRHYTFLYGKRRAGDKGEDLLIRQCAAEDLANDIRSKP